MTLVYPGVSLSGGVYLHLGLKEGVKIENIIKGKFPFLLDLSYELVSNFHICMAKILIVFPFLSKAKVYKMIKIPYS